MILEGEGGPCLDGRQSSRRLFAWAEQLRVANIAVLALPSRDGGLARGCHPALRHLPAGFRRLRPPRLPDTRLIA